MRDFLQALEDISFWDKDTEEFYLENGAPVVDRALQNREEIIALCAWIDAHKIRSYLEVGIWTGRLISALQEIFKFNLVAACDIGEAKRYDFEIKLPKEAHFFEGSSFSPIYLNWRKQLGNVDLTFIDSVHDYEIVKRNFEINRAFPHRYIAIHGISGSKRIGPGVKQFWDELEGEKTEIILPHLEIDSQEPTLGIGIWSESGASTA